MSVMLAILDDCLARLICLIYYVIFGSVLTEYNLADLSIRLILRQLVTITNII